MDQRQRKDGIKCNYEREWEHLRYSKAISLINQCLSVLTFLPMFTNHQRYSSRSEISSYVTRSLYSLHRLSTELRLISLLECLSMPVALIHACGFLLCQYLVFYRIQRLYFTIIISLSLELITLSLSHCLSVILVLRYFCTDSTGNYALLSGNYALLC